MKRVILFSLLCVAFATASKAQFENEEIEFESSGEAPTTDNPFRDDEDLGDESEGSGEVPIEPEDGGEVTFLDMTESTTTDPPEKKGSHNQGKSKSVEVEGETDTGSEETQENNSEIEEPVSETDPDKGVSDEVKGPDNSGVAVASTPSIQFLAAVIVGGCIGLLFAICVIMLLVYRMRKKDEGSYALDYGLDKKPQGNYEYTKGVDSKEYFA